MKEKDLGTIIRNARKKQGKTLKELADEIDVDTSTLQKYETGIIKNIPYDKLKKISIATGTAIPMLGTIGVSLGVVGGALGLIGGVFSAVISDNNNSKIITSENSVKNNNFENKLDSILLFFQNPEIDQEFKDKIFDILQNEYFKNKYKK